MGLADRLEALKKEAQAGGEEFKKRELARQVAEQQALAVQEEQARAAQDAQLKVREAQTKRLLQYHSVLDSENLLEELKEYTKVGYLQIDSLPMSHDSFMDQQYRRLTGREPELRFNDRHPATDYRKRTHFKDSGAELGVNLLYDFRDSFDFVTGSYFVYESQPGSDMRDVHTEYNYKNRTAPCSVGLRIGVGEDSNESPYFMASAFGIVGVAQGTQMRGGDFSFVHGSEVQTGGRRVLLKTPFRLEDPDIARELLSDQLVSLYDYYAKYAEAKPVSFSQPTKPWYKRILG